MIRAALAALLLGAAPQDAPKPNILWITCEDISPNLGCYGDPYAATPNLDAFAKQAVRYTRAFAPIGVCAPSRSSLILGTYASSVGTQHMRCKGTLPDYARCFPEYLRKAGYYCTNNVKTDYNFDAPKGSWDESSAKAHYRNRKPGQPFFAVFNFTSCHESQIRLPEAQYRKRIEKFAPGEVHDPAKAPLPPYHPDTPEVRQDWARYADAITQMDKEAGELLRGLEADGLAGETIVFYFSDHGAGMPRSKRWLYDSSLRVPMMVRFPEKWKKWAPGEAGTTTDRLVGFVDYGPTVLHLAGVEVPPHMQGMPFLGDRPAPPREFVHGFRDRMDERTDMIRAVRDARWKYIRNYLPDRPYAQHVSYMYEMPTMKAWQRLHDAGKLTGPQEIFFGAKPAEELYDTEADPHEVRNLAADPAQKEILERMRKALRDWLLSTRDLGFVCEAELRSRWGARAPHEAVRTDPASYPLEKLIDAADLASRGDPRSFDLVEDKDPALRYWGVVGCRVGKSTERLAKLLQDPAPWVRTAAADALADLPVLVESLKGQDEWVRLMAAEALDRMDGKARPALDAMKQVHAQDKREYVQRVLTKAIKDLEP
jgi:uncharacterized sulfatase